MPLAARVALTLAVGVATGVLSGMFGVGGAVISTPAIRVLGATAFESVGTTLPSIFPSAISGTLRYQREGLVRWDVVVRTGAIGSLAAVGGSFLSHVVPGHGHLLMVATAGFVALTAWRMGRTPRPVGPRPPGPGAATAGRLGIGWSWRYVVVGVGAGGLSGLLGLGGGVVMVPAFSEWLGMGIKEAVASSLAAVAILAVPGTITHALLNDINWSYAIPLSIGVVPGARLGSHLAIRSSDRRLRLVVAVGLGVIAAIYAAGELIAL